MTTIDITVREGKRVWKCPVHVKRYAKRLGKEIEIKQPDYSTIHRIIDETLTGTDNAVEIRISRKARNIRKRRG